MKKKWKKVPNFPKYLVSNFGQVFSSHGKNPRELTLSKDGLGYLRVTLCNKGRMKNIRVHRLVLELFKPTKRQNVICNHKNGKKQDNRINNLEWVTHSENLKHALNLKLNKCEKAVISDRGEKFLSATAAANYFNLRHKNQIASAIYRNSRCVNRRWKYV